MSSSTTSALSCPFPSRPLPRAHSLTLLLLRTSSQFSYDKILGYVEKAKAAGAEVLIGGTGDASTGFYVKPTVLVTKDPKSVTMVEEIFGPVLTTFVPSLFLSLLELSTDFRSYPLSYVYDDDKYEETCILLDGTTDYALTGCVYVPSFPLLSLAATVPEPTLRTASPKSAPPSLARTACSRTPLACSTSTSSSPSLPPPLPPLFSPPGPNPHTPTANRLEPSSGNSRSEARAGAGRTTRPGACPSSTASCRRGVSRRRSCRRGSLRTRVTW